MGSSRDESSAESPASGFERLWNANGKAPDLRAFLQLHPDATLRERAEVVRVDQRRRWQAGQPRALEDYFRTFPDLAAHPAVKVALVVAEYRTAGRNGRPYDREAFLARFADVPRLRERLDDPRPAAAPAPVVTRTNSQGEEQVVVRPPETDGVYDFVADDGISLAEPVSPLTPGPPLPWVPPPVQEDPDFGSANGKRSRSWPERVLSRRAAAWQANPSFGAIPRPWEWADILLRTDRSAWTRRQRDVMAAAGRFYLIGTLVVALGLTGVGFAGRLLRRTPKAPTALAAIDPVDAGEIARYVKQLEEIKAELAANRGDRANELLDQVDTPWRDWEWRYLKRACRPRTLEIPTPGSFASLLASADGRRLAAACDLFVPGATPTDGHSESRLRIWELTDGPIRERTTLSIADRAWRAVLSADGRRIAAATETAILVWDVDEAKELLRMKRPVKTMAQMALSPDGAVLAIAEWNGPITLWKVPGGEEIRTLDQGQSAASRLAFAPRGRRLVSESGTGIVLWDPDDGRQVMRKPTKGRMGGGVAVFSLDGSQLAATDDKGVIQLWDTGTGAELASFGTLGDGAGVLAFSPDGKQLAGSVGGEWSVVLWDTAVAQKARTFKLAYVATRNPLLTGLQDIAFSPDGARVAACRVPSSLLGDNRRSVMVWDVKTGSVIETIARAGLPAFTADGRMVFSSEAATPGRNGLSILNPGGARSSLEIAEAGAPSPDGTRLVGIGSNQIVSTDDGRVLKVLNLIAPVNFADVHYSPSGRRYVTVDRQKSLRFWDAATDTPLGEGRTITERIIQFLFSAKGERLITVGIPNRGDVGGPFSLGGVLSNNAVITVWDPERGGEPVVTVQGLYHRFTGRLSISPDGKRFATGSLHETVRVYDTDSGSITWDLEGHTQTAYGNVFSPDGRHLITSGLDLLEDRVTKGEVKVWDLETGRAVREFPGPAIVTAVSPDGRLAFAADLSGYVRGKPGKPKYRVWDLTTGETRYELEDALGGLRFTPDGKRFASFDKDAVHIRETTTGIELLSLPLHRAGAGGPAPRNPLSFALDGSRLVLSGRLDSKYNLTAATVVWFAPEPPGRAEGGQGQARRSLP